MTPETREAIGKMVERLQDVFAGMQQEHRVKPEVVAAAAAIAMQVWLEASAPLTFVFAFGTRTVEVQAKTLAEAKRLARAKIDASDKALVRPIKWAIELLEVRQ